ncbi:hypothetical protein KY321_03080 [Candidatus Woesearchaeota archaeon]|nr:hypothetical protein [Candidatus Woesearchaeota archaeon]
MNKKGEISFQTVMVILAVIFLLIVAFLLIMQRDVVNNQFASVFGKLLG